MIAAPEQIGDWYIMDVALESKVFNDKEIRIINYCCLYLHVTTVLEMFDPDGVALLPHMRRCDRMVTAAALAPQIVSTNRG
jgi:hypothetical protein